MLFVLIGVMLFVYVIVFFGFGLVFKFLLFEFIMVFNVVIFGVIIVFVFVVVKGWKDLVILGVFVGVFGYVIGILIVNLVFEFWFG